MSRSVGDGVDGSSAGSARPVHRPAHRRRAHRPLAAVVAHPAQLTGSPAAARARPAERTITGGRPSRAQWVTWPGLSGGTATPNGVRRRWSTACSWRPSRPRSTA